MNIVHFAITPLAGAPITIVNALNRHTSVNARLIDLERWGLFEHDVVFAEQPELAMELVEQADIIHLQNYLWRDSSQFAPIDFRALERQGKQLIRHYHSVPQLIADKMGIGVEALMQCDLPSLVIAQYPERLFPRSQVVPNILPHTTPGWSPAVTDPTMDFFFSPTNNASAWEDRWMTKGAPETIALLQEVCRATQTRCDIVTGVPHAQALERKQQSRVVVDDITNGSYHLTGMEGLCQGKAVVGYLDERMLRLLHHFSGTSHCPYVNVRLENAFPVLARLATDRELTDALGAEGREWMITYWNEKRMTEMFVQIYQTLLHDPTRICRQPELALDSMARKFITLELPELIYQDRKTKAQTPD